MDIFLSLLIWLNGLTIQSGGNDCVNFNLLGQYQVGKKEILICEENIQKHNISKTEVIQHEYVHYVYDKRKIKTTILPNFLYHFLVKHFVSDGEKLFVFLHENDYSSDEELEARLLSRLPTGFLFFL